jgi:outer membrane protein TolC
VNFSLPLFLRKERGNFQVAKFKLQDAELDLQFENQVLKNKIEYQLEEISSLKSQIDIANELVSNFQTMLDSEEKLFLFGESSLSGFALRIEIGLIHVLNGSIKTPNLIFMQSS